VGRLELPGAGQVVVEGNYAYIGHMQPPAGTTIVDISDPKHPTVVSQLDIAPNLHSHKVRVHGDVMLVNHEKYRGYRGDEKPRGGLKVFDVSNRSHPKEMAFVEVSEWGYHRFTFDGRYCYGSPNPEGYVGNIMQNFSVFYFQQDRDSMIQGDIPFKTVWLQSRGENARSLI
jgi:hypothetical protein